MVDIHGSMFGDSGKVFIQTASSAVEVGDLVDVQQVLDDASDVASDAATNAIAAERTIARIRAGLVPSLRGPKVMASPPAVTTGAAATLTGQKVYAGSYGGSPYSLGHTGSKFTVSRLDPDPAGSGIALAKLKNVTGNTGSTPNTQGPMTVSFMLDDSDVELIVYDSAGGILIKVDDEFVSLTPQATATNPTFVKLAFGSRAYRRIDVMGGVNFGFSGVILNATGGIWRAPKRGPRVAIVTHSFGGTTVEAYGTWFGHALGWDDVMVSGVGSTGYLATSGGTKKKFRDRLATDVIPFNPDIVMFLAGANDSSATAAELAAEMAACVTTIKAALPNAIVIGSNDAIGGVETMTALNLDQRDAGKAAWEAAGGVWLDITEMPMDGTARPTRVTALSTSAGHAGSTGIAMVTTDGYGFNIGDTVDIGSGATRERICITDIQNTSGTWKLRFAGTARYAHAAGEPIVAVGPSYMTGIGKVGTTTGVGNADVLVSSDGVHPQVPAGHVAIGYAWASLVREWLAGQ